MGAARLRRVVRRATRIRYDPTTLTEALCALPTAPCVWHYQRMLPSILVGSVVSDSGEATPFVLRTATGKVELGSCQLPDRLQAKLPQETRQAIQQQVRDQLEMQIREVRVGQLHCSECGRWIDVERHPKRWPCH